MFPLSISEAADILGVSRCSLSRVVNGHAKLSLKMANKWAELTDTSIESWYQMQVNLDLYEFKQYNIESN